ncbi:hypothetical protein M0812_27064 [Anaeramoeba flamelloides]|uniref:Transcription factor n=1 Tax=Anaeramoeba flamelloides TaxID=1746091 RepID=A0AAV7YCE9_9EUKA|nr:hypothetical protein M0812_27064 [Anaeramoeba flamelloides]
MIQNFKKQNPIQTDSNSKIMFDCFQLQQQFGLFLHTRYHYNNNFRIESAISKFLSEKTDPKIRSKMKKQLSIVVQVLLQNGFIVPNNSFEDKEKMCYLCDNWKQAFTKIQNTPNFPNMQNNETETNESQFQNKKVGSGNRTISMLSLQTIYHLQNGKNTRDKITNETGYARQRICTVLSIFKGLGLVKEGTKKNRVLKLNKRQKESFFSVQDLSKKVIDLRNRRRALFEKMKNLVGELETKIDKEDQNELKCYGWFDQYTQNYFSRKEKYITNIEDSISQPSKFPLLKTHKKLLPFPKISSYLGFCSTLNCSRFSQNYQSSIIRVPVKTTENKRSNNSADKKKKILVIKTRKRIGNRTCIKKKNILKKLKMSRKNGSRLLTKDHQKTENDDIIRAAYLILSIAPSRRKSPQLQAQTQTHTHTHTNMQQESNTNPKYSKLQNTQRGSEENLFVNAFTEPVFLKHQIRDSKQLTNQRQLNNNILNHQQMDSVSQLANFGINNTMLNNQNNLNLSILKMLDINQLIQQFNSETSMNK